jgi:hypothetical protein
MLDIEKPDHIERNPRLGEDLESCLVISSPPLLLFFGAGRFEGIMASFGSQQLRSDSNPSEDITSALFGTGKLGSSVSLLTGREICKFSKSKTSWTEVHIGL